MNETNIGENYKKEKEIETERSAEKLRKITKKTGCVLGLSQILGINAIAAHCDSNAPCTSGLCFLGACWGYSCKQLACSGQQSGTCENRQCSDHACKDGAGWGPICDKTQCSEHACADYACKEQACVNHHDGLCPGNLTCGKKEAGEPWMTISNKPREAAMRRE